MDFSQEVRLLASAGCHRLCPLFQGSPMVHLLGVNSALTDGGPALLCPWIVHLGWMHENGLTYMVCLVIQALWSWAPGCWNDEGRNMSAAGTLLGGACAGFCTGLMCLWKDRCCPG